MGAVLRPPDIPSDPGLPGARGVLGVDGELAVRRFLSRRGWRAEATRPVQAVYRPGRSMLVRYRVDATGPRGRTGLTLCVEHSGEPRRPARAPEDFEARFGIADPVERFDDHLVWAFPYDPTLRDLPDAAWGPAVRRLQSGTSAVAVQPMRYRPRRRAVFRYRTLARGPERRWQTRFGKVMPSAKVRRAGDVAPALREARGDLRFGVAQPAGRQLVFTDELAGRSLRELLVQGGSLPSPERVASVPARLDRALAHAAPVLGHRPAPIEIAEPAGRLVTSLLPDLEGEVSRIVDAVGAAEAAPVSIVHGDLYEAQMLVGSRWSLGLIDLDDLSLGDPAMDAANFCAHLMALALAAPAAAPRLMAYRQLVRPAFAAALGVRGSDLDWREALCMLQLATGPFRVLDPAWPAEVRLRVNVAVRLLQGP